MTYLDLTHPFTPNMPVYPGDPVPELKQIASIHKHGFSDCQLTTGMHVGTHMDGPAHMLDNARQLVDFPVDHFFGAGVLIDARNQPLDRQLLDTVSIQKNDIVLILTGWGEKWGHEDYFSNPPQMTFDLAQAFIDRGVKMVGFDTPSPDSAPFLIHKLLLSHEILILENLTNLSPLLKQEVFEVMVLPLKIQADSAPVRVVAKTL